MWQSDTIRRLSSMLALIRFVGAALDASPTEPILHSWESLAAIVAAGVALLGLFFTWIWRRDDEKSKDASMHLSVFQHAAYPASLEITNIGGSIGIVTGAIFRTPSDEELSEKSYTSEDLIIEANYSRILPLWRQLRLYADSGALQLPDVGGIRRKELIYTSVAYTTMGKQKRSAKIEILLEMEWRDGRWRPLSVSTPPR